LTIKKKYTFNYTYTATTLYQENEHENKSSLLIIRHAFINWMDMNVKYFHSMKRQLKMKRTVLHSMKTYAF